MKYSVTWAESADNALTSIWLAARDRAAVTTAARAIDTALKLNPRNVGESRDLGRRILYIHPLVVIFEVHQPDMLVKVLQVWRAVPRRRR